ncbi:aminotransferase class V-fold PLP-dependent enzyme [Flavobacteriaceae bacterium TP-CH-4]|uniref:Aminotransferase class V-fold PLP-dependent enzyme n=2 Tax=Pelagihabitans pacificus TaxID=2696054 RepID=A0A967E786_9FLAO|nr:aminotransferase class V-fold PLP-dependent enzyme [Pelagihabitans pacificus]
MTPDKLWAQATKPVQYAIDALRGQATNGSESYWETVQSQFPFAKGLTYFNNGSLGACPAPIREAAHSFRNMLDDFPSKYMWGGWETEKETVRTQVADLFSVSSEEIALIHNTTEGMNLIARGIDLKEGDEVILADHEHTSAVAPWTVWQGPKGIRLVRPTLPILPESTDEIINIYRKSIGPKTKVISICHLVNTNGMLLPIKEISEMAHKKGILVAVDGAQGAGMLNTDLTEMDCDFYTVSAHKWLFSPKGMGIFYAKKEAQHHLRPLIVARGYEDTSIRRLENYNTRNLPELLALGAALDYRDVIGAQKIQDRTYDLKHYFRGQIKQHPKLLLKTPGPDTLSAGIQVVEVVGKDVQKVKDQLFEEYGIDCRPMTKFGLNAVRLSFAIFITKEQIDDLIEALDTIART